MAIYWSLENIVADTLSRLDIYPNDTVDNETSAFYEIYLSVIESELLVDEKLMCHARYLSR